MITLTGAGAGGGEGGGGLGGGGEGGGGEGGGGEGGGGEGGGLGGKWRMLRMTRSTSWYAVAFSGYQTPAVAPGGILAQQAWYCARCKKDNVTCVGVHRVGTNPVRAAYESGVRLVAPVDAPAQRHVRHAEVLEVVVGARVVAHAREVQVAGHGHGHAPRRLPPGALGDARVGVAVDGGEVAAGRAALNLVPVVLFGAREVGARGLLDDHRSAVVTAHRGPALVSRLFAARCVLSATEND